MAVVKNIQDSGWKFMQRDEIARFYAAEEAGKLMCNDSVATS